MSEGIPIGMEMESAGCIEAMRAAKKRNRTWYCPKCEFHNKQKDVACRSCGHRRYRK